MLDGLTPSLPSETHGSPQALTGFGFEGSSWLSVDQFIANALGLPPPLLLGVQSGSGSQFFNFPVKPNRATHGAIPPTDDPSVAFNALFGGQGSVTPMMGQGTPMPRKAILDLARQQIKSLEATMGSQQKAKLDAHLAAIASIDGSMDR